MPHLSSHEIQELIYQKWKHGLSKNEQEEIDKAFGEARAEYWRQVEEATEKVNSLRRQIHEI